MPQPKHWSAHANAARLEDLQFMADTGETLTGAARRLHLEVKTLHKWCLRHNHLDLYHQLANREPERHTTTNPTTRKEHAA